MKICLIVEGCYPYVVGGVSAWVQILMQRMPEHQFVIVSIGAESRQRGQFRYPIPANVTEVREYFLDEPMVPDAAPSAERPLTDAQRRALLDLVRGTAPDWSQLFELFGGKNPLPVQQFLMSEEFLSLVQGLAEGPGRNTPFKDLFWALRSMLLPALELLRCPVPEADLYHTVATGYAGLLGAKFSYFAQKPYLVTEHGIYTREREEEILKADWVPGYFKPTWIGYFRALSQAAYRQAGTIVSLFQGARELQIGLGAEERKCQVIPNGIDVGRFAAMPPLDPAPHPLHIGAVLRIVPIKDVKTMIYSFHRIKVARPDATLDLIGPCDEDPDYYEECKALIHRLNCPDIRFVGRADVTDWLPKLDLVLLTSISEGQPFVLLEAMAARRPVVATNVGSCREIIEGAGDGLGPAGRVVPVMSPAAIADGILEISRSPAQLRALAENGYRRVVRFYQDKDFLAAYRSLYREAVQNTQQEVNCPWRASALN